jgi:hypothetical protein
VLALVAAAVVGAIRHSSGSRHADRPTTKPRPGVTTTMRLYATGTNYRATTIAAAVEKLLRTPTTPLPAAPTTTTPPSKPGAGFSLTELRTSPASLLACARILSGSAEVTPVAVDFAEFSGKPAAVFVLPTAGHPEDVDVWVVKSVCSNASFDYYFRRVAR